MNVLKGIQEAFAARLHTQSAEVLETVKRAAKCVTWLHVHGCTVQQVTVRPGYAVIEIDQPTEWLKGSIQVRRVRGDQREVQMVTKVLDCQVQWIVREKHPLLRREG